LDKREDIKLFVKLPGWFKIETPLGTYNPDWAILRHDNTVLYLVREPKHKEFREATDIEAEKSAAVVSILKCSSRFAW